jgi:hypothetical protein
MVGWQMNIANIMGLHLGCRIKHSFMHDNILREGISLLTGVEILQGGTILLEAGFKEYNYQFCKLILKPLSKITDEDKAEFQKKYVKFNDFVSRSRVEFYNNLSYDVYTRSTSGWSENIEYKLSIDQLLWLASKGYDIGIIPDEYKEVEE